MTQQIVPEITPAELARNLEAGEPVQIVDVRAQSGLTRPSEGLIPEHRVHAIAGSRLLRMTALEGSGLDPAMPVVVICAHGNDSKIATSHLNRLGARARSLRGGMAAWMMVVIPRELEPPASLDHLVQFDRVGKESLSYILVSSGEAVIIDPPRDYRSHLQYIEESGARLVAVADTHVHADYISGAAGIARERGVPYYLHRADTVYPYDLTPGSLEIAPVSEGMSLRIGRCQLTALHTPGHSPGSVTFLVGEDAAFTGDFLFVASVGRPDLADRTEEWSADLWKSIQNVKRRWPPGLMIYPAHYSSQTPRSKGGAIGDSFGNLLRQNPSLQMTEESEFVEWIRQHATAPPEAYRVIKGINVGLFAVTEREAEYLEGGKNECAVG